MRLQVWQKCRSQSYVADPFQPIPDESRKLYGRSAQNFSGGIPWKDGRSIELEFEEN